MSYAQDDPVSLLLANTWEPALAITGAAGLPAPEDGGNVLRPSTSLKLSLRIPPTLDAARAGRRLEELLESDPPYGAKVRYEARSLPGLGRSGDSTMARRRVQSASQRHFGKPAMFKGQGGSIPFMAMLGERFPEAQFFITGGLGPGRTPMAPTSSCTCRTPSASPAA